MIMEIISYVRGLFAPKRKRCAAEDLDLGFCTKFPKISTHISNTPDDWLSNTNNLRKLKQSFMEPTDLTIKPPLLKTPVIEIDDDDFPIKRNFDGKMGKQTSTPNISGTSKARENGLEDYSFKARENNKRLSSKFEKFEYFEPSPSFFNAFKENKSFKNSREPSKIHFPAVTKLNGTTTAEYTYRLDEKKKYEELLNRSRNLTVNSYDSFAEYSTPIGKIQPFNRSRKILNMVTKTIKPIETLDLTNGDLKKKSRLSTKETIIKLLDGLDKDSSDVIVVKDSDSDVEILPTPPSPKPDFEIKRVNSLKTFVLPSEPNHEEWVTNKIKQHSAEIEKREKQLKLHQSHLTELQTINTEARARQLEAQVQKCLNIREKIILPTVIIQKLPKLTSEQEDMVSDSLDKTKSQDKILVRKFGLEIRRRDMITLAGLNWLNDEVINFYMNLIIERGKLDKFPSVYAFNTFFYPKLIKTGQTSLRRWTRKIDIFSYDMICVPVHMALHWCMAIIDFRAKTISYYDSMGKPNHECTESLLKYLQEEHVDKKKSKFDSAGWKLLNLKDIPQQMNGSDCGVFSCTYAEFVSRNADLSFSQDDMPYLRRKMVAEIMLENLLIH